MESIRKLKRIKLLSKDEQKKIRGGTICTRGMPDGSNLASYEPMGMASGYAWCEFWSSVGYRCTCESYPS